MKKLIIPFLLLAFITVSCKESTNKKEPVAEEQVVNEEELDTGVGENGVAKSSSPAFLAEGGEMVTMDNIVRAETAKYLAEETIKSGPNKFRHERQGIQLDKQTVIRSNFDQIYSYGVFDVSEGLTITIPAYERLQLVQVFDEDHVTIGVVLPGQTLSFIKEDLNYGDHVYLFMRTQPPSYDEKGMDMMRQRQDMVITKAGSNKPYVSETKYDVNSFNTLRTELIGRAVAEGKPYLGFITDIKDIISPQYQIINLAGWGGLPVKYANYFPIIPGDEVSKDGGCSSFTFNAPELDYAKGGYWSLTLYDAKGWVATEVFNTNSNKATKNNDGSYTINFNCEDGAVNNLQTVKNWNGLFRCYLPLSKENILEFTKDVITNHKVLSKK